MLAFIMQAEHKGGTSQFKRVRSANQRTFSICSLSDLIPLLNLETGKSPCQVFEGIIRICLFHDFTFFHCAGEKLFSCFGHVREGST